MNYYIFNTLENKNKNKMTRHIIIYILSFIFMLGFVFGLNGVVQLYYPLLDEFLNSTLYVKLNYVIIFILSFVMYGILYGILALFYIPIMILDLI